MAFMALAAAGFFATLAFAPRLPTLKLRDPRVLTALHQETAHRLKRDQLAWTRIPKPGKAQGRAAAAGPARPLTVGFYVSWDEASRESLARNIDKLDVVAPQWIALDGLTGKIALTADPRAETIVAGAKHPPALLPVVHNAQNAVWNGPAADAVVLNPAARQNLIQQLVDLARKRGYAGYVFDLENLSPKAAAAYPAFIAQAKAALAVGDRDIWLTAPVDDEAPVVEALAASFQKSGGNMRQLLLGIVTAPTFRMRRVHGGPG